MFDDNRKIGIALCALGCLLTGLGAVLFLDRALLTLGNLCFLMGVGFILGPSRMVTFFFKRDKLKGSCFFFGGFFVILWKWAIVGLILELYGIWCLFSSFLPNVVASLKLSPVGWICDLPGFRQVGFCDEKYC
eukprot:GHVN01061124.1.p1 GENE.GHVN01061124.1~~GHVN01061124.1.p1  ORF type:complete len:133 (-),score=3.58 GHVN01061124.1:9-407(-)